MLQDDIFGFGTNRHAGLVLEASADRFSSQYIRHLGAIATIGWVQTGSPTGADLQETIDMTAGYQEDDPVGDDEEEADDISAVAEAVADCLVHFGVPSDTAEAAVNGEDAAAKRAYDAVQSSVESSAQSVEDLLMHYTVGDATVAENMTKGQFKLAKRQRMLRKKRNPNAMMKKSSAQRMAFKKFLKKSLKGSAKRKRKLTKAKRARRGVYS